MFKPPAVPDPGEGSGAQNPPADSGYKSSYSFLDKGKGREKQSKTKSRTSSVLGTFGGSDGSRRKSPTSRRPRAVRTRFREPPRSSSWKYASFFDETEQQRKLDRQQLAQFRNYKNWRHNNTTSLFSQDHYNPDTTHWLAVPGTLSAQQNNGTPGDYVRPSDAQTPSAGPEPGDFHQLLREKSVTGMGNSRSENLTMHLDLDLEDDLDETLEEFNKLCRHGDFVSADQFFEYNLEDHIDKPYILVHYAEMLLQQGRYRDLLEFEYDDAIFEMAADVVESEPAITLRLYWDLMQLSAKTYLQQCARDAGDIIGNALVVLHNFANHVDGAMGSTEIKILGLVINLSSNKQLVDGCPDDIIGSFPLRFYKHLYATMMTQGRVWDLHDLIILMPSAKAIESLLTRLCGINSIRAGLRHIVSEWKESIHDYDASTTLALLSIATFILLYHLHAEQDDKTVEDVLKQALELGNLIAENDTSSMKTRPYLRLLLAKTRYDESKGPKSFQDFTDYLRDSSGVTYTTPRGPLPLYFPADGESPEWNLLDAPNHLKDPVRLILRTARQLCDYSLEALTLAELIRLSSNPKQEFADLCRLQQSVQGDICGYSLTLAARYFVSDDHQSRKWLRTEMTNHLWDAGSSGNLTANQVFMISMLLHQLEGKPTTVAAKAMATANVQYRNLDSSLLREIKRKMAELREKMERKRSRPNGRTETRKGKNTPRRPDVQNPGREQQDPPSFAGSRSSEQRERLRQAQVETDRELSDQEREESPNPERIRIPKLPTGQQARRKVGPGPRLSMRFNGNNVGESSNYPLGDPISSNYANANSNNVTSYYYPPQPYSNGMHLEPYFPMQYQCSQWEPLTAPPAEVSPSTTRTPPPPPPGKDPELEAMRRRLAELQRIEEVRARETEERKHEARIREQAEQEAMRQWEKKQHEEKAQQEERAVVLYKGQQDIEYAKKMAKRTARDQIEAEKKAEAERKRMEAETKARADFEARKELEAREEAKRKEEEIRRAAETEAKAKANLEAGTKARGEEEQSSGNLPAKKIDWMRVLQEIAELRAEMKAKEIIEQNMKLKERDEIHTKSEDKGQKEAKVKSPIHFKDALQRKFIFPFHPASTWSGMEDLIGKIFADVSGPLRVEVDAGLYDLCGPDDEIIVRQAWEDTIQPGWTIIMNIRSKGPSPHDNTGHSHITDAGGSGPRLTSPWTFPSPPRPPMSPPPGSRMTGEPHGAGVPWYTGSPQEFTSFRLSQNAKISVYQPSVSSERGEVEAGEVEDEENSDRKNENNGGNTHDGDNDDEKVGVSSSYVSSDAEPGTPKRKRVKRWVRNTSFKVKWRVRRYYRRIRGRPLDSSTSTTSSWTETSTSRSGIIDGSFSSLD